MLAKAMLAALWWGMLLAPLTGRAHPATLTSAEATVEADGRFQLVAHFDTLAFALNDTSARIGNAPMEELLAGPRPVLETRLAEAKGRFLHGLRVVTDRGPGSVDASEFPTAEQVLAWQAATTPVLPVVLPVRITGRLPEGAGTVAFRFPDVLEQVILTVQRPEEEPFAEPVEAGETSTALPIRVTASSPPPPEPGNLARLGGYVHMGFRHILPDGLDHILFVLGLFLFSPRLRPLLVQVTAFTVAHSITLGLSLYGVVRLPPAVVEPLIALSIVFVAVENLCTTELRASRTLVVFGFGLMHGLGFNCGVELGQLTVVAIAAGTIGWLRRWKYYRLVVVWPLSGGIAAVAMFWTVQRIFF